MKIKLSSAFVTLVVSALTALVVVKFSAPNRTDASQSSLYYPDGQMVRTVNLAMSDYPDFTYAAENAVEAVVYVQVTSKSQQRQYIDPFFRFFFGDEDNRSLENLRKGSGSGVIIRSDGYIVTNNHVVANATEVKVTLNNNKTYDAKVIGTDPATDVALIKIDANNLPVLQFADSDKLRLGEWVLAIGSPMGAQLRSTITAGIVSAKGRSLPSNNAEFKIESFIQTDAAVNPGNSGGALVNKSGELVGINTAIVSTTGSYSGYSMAIPSNIVKKVVSDLIDFGSVMRATLGISMTALTDDQAKENNLNSLDGVYIIDVQKGSAADKAGLKQGDILLAIDDSKLKSPSAVQEKVNSFRPGDKAVLTIVRAGKEQKLNVTLQKGVDEISEPDENGVVLFYGAKLGPAEKGVEIIDAGNGKMAAAGATNGFIILYVNDQKVNKPEDVINIAKKTSRSIFIEGVTPSGRPGYFGFRKDE